MKCNCEITDVQLDKVNKIALVGVKATVNKKEYIKAFRVDATQKIGFESFREKLIEELMKEIRKEDSMDENISDLTSIIKQPFNITLDKVV